MVPLAKRQEPLTEEENPPLHDELNPDGRSPLLSARYPLQENVADLPRSWHPEKQLTNELCRKTFILHCDGRSDVHTLRGSTYCTLDSERRPPLPHDQNN